ncbi:MAG: hypothetical protein DDG60_07380 [Anaerolineae bacterium]|nr:MAG: hypothetical protein DDG60_07380 [Anaerolineae bacterium]
MNEITAKSLSESARTAYQEGDFENAARLFGEAASRLTEKLEAAEMKNNQSVAWLQAGNPKAAYEAARDTAQLFAQASDFRREGIAWSNEAAALQALGRANEAFEKYRLAAEAFQRAGEDKMRNDVYQAMAGIKLKQGKVMEALFHMQMGLAGVKHPTLKQKILLSMLRLRAW